MKLHSISGLITGAASGIGRCCALELARVGARVVAGDVDEDGLEELQEEAHALPGRIFGHPLDVAREDSVKAFVAGACEALGQAPNLAVNNAAILRDGWLVKREEEGWVRHLPTSQWKAVLETNLTGPYYVAREAATAMLADGVSPALIVNISSITSTGNPGQSSYAASKAGLDAVTRTWALELASHGIRVAGIAPGLTDTPMAANVPAEALAGMLAQIPLGRMARPEEIWAGLRFIIECDYFTGRIIAIDGGAMFL
jgi:3-oxoacyl-[acyl-carrier protein] reductase